MHELFLSGGKKYDALKLNLKWVIKDKCSLFFKNLIGIKKILLTIIRKLSGRKTYNALKIDYKE